MSPDLLSFQRLLPEGGIVVYPEVRYVDSNDMTTEERMASKFFLHEDKEYQNLRRYRSGVNKGQKVGKMHCVYVIRDREKMGFMTLTEFLDNPDGYGKGDFAFAKIIYPKFRHTKYSRYASSDLMHMVFKSGVARNLYSYFLAREGSGVADSFWDRIDKRTPCLGQVYCTDGPDVQKYILVKKEFSVGDRKIVLVEFNGDIYRNMDLRAYFLTAPGRTKEVVERWLREMDEAAEKVIK